MKDAKTFTLFLNNTSLKFTFRRMRFKLKTLKLKVFTSL